MKEEEEWNTFVKRKKEIASLFVLELVISEWKKLGQIIWIQMVVEGSWERP